MQSILLGVQGQDVSQLVSEFGTSLAEHQVSLTEPHLLSDYLWISPRLAQSLQLGERCTWGRSNNAEGLGVADGFFLSGLHLLV